MAIRYDPFERMDRMFDHMRRSMMNDYLPALSGGESKWSAADINLSLETDEDGYVVIADLPGFEKEDLDIRFVDGVLTIRGSHDIAEEHDTGWSQRRRSVHEQLRVPGEVIEDELAASYRNGVLEIHLPTVEDVDDDTHRIPID